MHISWNHKPPMSFRRRGNYGVGQGAKAGHLYVVHVRHLLLAYLPDACTSFSAMQSDVRMLYVKLTTFCQVAKIVINPSKAPLDRRCLINKKDYGLS
jgi:hypothetical protein